MIKVTYSNFDKSKSIKFVCEDGCLPYGQSFLWRNEFYYFEKVGF